MTRRWESALRAVGGVFGLAIFVSALAPVVWAQGRRVAAPADTTAPAAGQPAGQPAGRAALEQAIRRRFEQVVRNRLGLTDAQIVQLRATNRKFAERRRELAQRERGLRAGLQAELRPGVAADQPHVASLMDSLLTIERDRLDLLEDEQRDLSAFMTPVQRAQYYGLEEQLRKRLQAFQQRAAATPF